MNQQDTILQNFILDTPLVELSCVTKSKEGQEKDHHHQMKILDKGFKVFIKISFILII